VNPELRAFCRLEVKAPDVTDALGDLSSSLLESATYVEADAGTTLWRIDKFRSSSDLVTVYQRLTI
jgi:hypothetical protein